MVPRKRRPSLLETVTALAPDAHKTITALAALATVFIGVKSHNDTTANRETTAAVYGATQVQVAALEARIDSLGRALRKHERKGATKHHVVDVPGANAEEARPNAVRRLVGWLTRPFSRGGDNAKVSVS